MSAGSWQSWYGPREQRKTRSKCPQSILRFLIPAARSLLILLWALGLSFTVSGLWSFFVSVNWNTCDLKSSCWFYTIRNAFCHKLQNKCVCLCHKKLRDKWLLTLVQQLVISQDQHLCNPLELFVILPPDGHPGSCCFSAVTPMFYTWAREQARNLLFQRLCLF